MERRWYQCCKTEMDVVVRCRKHTRTGNILYAVINSYRKKYTLLTQSELESLRKIRIHQAAKNTPFCENCKRNVSYFIPTYTKLIVTRTTKHIRKWPSRSMREVTDHSTQHNLKVEKDAVSYECLCGRWDNHDPDVPLRLRTVHRTAGGYMALAIRGSRYATRQTSQSLLSVAGVVTVAGRDDGVCAGVSIISRIVAVNCLDLCSVSRENIPIDSQFALNNTSGRATSGSSF